MSNFSRAESRRKEKEQKKHDERRKRELQPHLNILADLLQGFFNFLCQRPQPSDMEVRQRFTADNNQWKAYCLSHQLMNAHHLFVTNVCKTWEKHKRILPQNAKP